MSRPWRRDYEKKGGIASAPARESFKALPARLPSQVLSPVVTFNAGQLLLTTSTLASIRLVISCR